MTMPLLPNPDDPPVGGHHFLDELWDSIRRRLPQPGDRRVEPHVLVPVADRIVRVPVRTVLVHAQVRGATTKDDAVVDVDAVVHLRVTDPGKMFVTASDCADTAPAAAEDSLRAVLGRTDLNTVVSDRDHVGADVRAVIDARIGESATGWGARVDRVEIGDVVLTADPRRRDAAAWRAAARVPAPGGGHPDEARAAEVAKALEENPEVLRLQLPGAAGDQEDTVVVALRIEVLRSLVRDCQPGRFEQRFDAARRIDRAAPSEEAQPDGRSAPS
jgi:regulator of protease activity HflC (stomatin/prohibitin superfamily)